MASWSLLPLEKLRLYCPEGSLINYALVMPLHIVLRNLAIVLYPLLRKKVYRVLFLQERIPHVLLIGKNALHRIAMPPLATCGSGDAFRL